MSEPAPTPAAGPSRSKEERDQELLRAYEAGKTIAEVAQEFDLRGGSVYRILAQNGAKLRPPPDLSVRNAQIREAREAGRPLGEVAREFGLRPDSVCRILRPRRANEARNWKIILAYQAGEDLATIAARVGLSKTGVQWVLRDVPRRRSAAALDAAAGREARDERLGEAYARGVPIAEMSAAAGLKNRNSARRILKRNGVAPRSKDGRNKEIVGAFEDGASPEDVAERFGLSPQTVRRILNGMGVKMRDRSERNEAMVRASEAGKTAREIGREFGLHPETVRIILRRMPRPWLWWERDDPEPPR
jgi:DNA-binding NarL/FixJ family response regulator